MQTKSRTISYYYCYTIRRGAKHTQPLTNRPPAIIAAIATIALTAANPKASAIAWKPIWNNSRESTINLKLSIIHLPCGCFLLLHQPSIILCWAHWLFWHQPLSFINPVHSKISIFRVYKHKLRSYSPLQIIVLLWSYSEKNRLNYELCEQKEIS